MQQLSIVLVWTPNEQASRACELVKTGWLPQTTHFLQEKTGIESLRESKTRFYWFYKRRPIRHPLSI